jgi:CheY-like chemotaxis protein
MDMQFLKSQSSAAPVSVCLSVCKSLAEVMGGSIVFTSKPGIGSTYEATRQLRQSDGVYRACSIPVIALTAHALKDD